MKKTKPSPGRIVMSRYTSTEEPYTGVHITIEDRTSGCRVLEAYMSLEEFAKAVTASHGNCEFEFYKNAPIGKKQEHKKIGIPFTFDQMMDAGNDRSVLQAAVAPFEVDGWKGRTEDLENHHCSAGQGIQSVSFTRYV